MSLKCAIVDFESALPSITSRLARPRHCVLAVDTAASIAGHNVEVYDEMLNGIHKPPVTVDVHLKRLRAHRIRQKETVQLLNDLTQDLPMATVG